MISNIEVRINVPGYGVGEEGGSEVVAEVSGRQCAKVVSDGGGIERLDASRQREFQYNHRVQRHIGVHGGPYNRSHPLKIGKTTE